MDLDRRTALGVLGAIGAAALAPKAEARDDLPQAMPPSHRGLFGRMTGAKAAVAALCEEGTPCVFGVPGAQNNEFWDAMKGHGLPYLLVANESSASVMADASARVTGRVGTFAVVPGPGLTNALTGIGEALYDSVPIVGIVTDIDRGPEAHVGQVHGLNNAAILRPVCKGVFEVRHQGQIPSAIQQAFRLARCGEPGPTAVVIPFPFFATSWDYDGPAPPSPPPPFDENGYRKASKSSRIDAGGSAFTRGWGSIDASSSLQAVAEVLQAPVATSVSGKGAIARHSSPRRRLGLWKTGDEDGREDLQGRRHGFGRRREVQRGLDRELFDPQGQGRHPRRRQPE